MTDGDSRAAAALDCAACEALGHRDVRTIIYPPSRQDDELARGERIRGVLVGGALGDAIGTAVTAKEPILLAPASLTLRTRGATQLALFTAEGVLRRMIRGHAKGIWPSYEVVLHAYQRWLFTQNALPEAIRDRWQPYSGGPWPDGWLVAEHAMHGRRTDHPTTVKAIRTMTRSTPDLVDGEFVRRPNTSDSVGALVRSAPDGTIVPSDMAFETGVRTAVFTHGGPLGLFLPGVMTRMIQELVAGATLAAGLARGRSDLEGWTHHSRALALVDKTMNGTPGSTQESGAARAFRVGVGRALLFEEVGGDPMGLLWGTAVSDGRSAAIVAGQLIGARFGTPVFPAAWRHALDLAPVIDEMADVCVLAHRVFALDRRVPELERLPDDGGDEHPICGFLWSRFPVGAGRLSPSRGPTWSWPVSLSVTVWWSDGEHLQRQTQSRRTSPGHEGRNAAPAPPRTRPSR